MTDQTTPDAEQDFTRALTPASLAGAATVPMITIPLWAFDRAVDALRALLDGGERTATIDEALPLLEELRQTSFTAAEQRVALAVPAEL